MKVYVSGPYTAATPADVRRNVDTAMAMGIDLLMLGHSPVIPHLSYYLDRFAQSRGIDIDYEEWLRMDIDLLAGCDALLLIGSSPGADREVAFAKDRGIPVVTEIGGLA
jgi:hypothetical protein